MKKKKRKLKKWVIKTLFIIPIVIIVIFLIFHSPKKEKAINNVKEENLFAKIEEKVDIDNDLLKWIIKEYTTEEKVLKYLDNNGNNDSIWHELTGYSLKVLNDKYNKKDLKEIKDDKDATLSFIGDVSLADDWYIIPKYDSRDKGIYGILSEGVVKTLKDSTYTIANNEFTISNRGSKLPNKYYTFRGAPERLKIYDEMGVDLVTLANNHVYDYGDDAFHDMLDALNEYNIPYIGAGRNIEEAKKVHYISINGYKIAFINATRAEKFILTPEAGDNSGGVFRCYDPSLLIETIKEAKQQSDYVITLIHWGREDSHELENVQKETSKEYIDAGTDVIVGTHAHVLQGIEFYNDKPIIYNLGDFIFNNETKDTGIFQIKLLNNGKMEYYFIPCLEKDEYTKELNDGEKLNVISKMNTWSINAQINELGKIEQITS